MNCYCAAGVVLLSVLSAATAEPLPGTEPLTDQGDLAVKMVAGIDKYLMRELAGSVAKRQQHWKPDYSSAAAYNKSIEPNRQRLRKILGVVDPRLPVKMEFLADAATPALIAEAKNYTVHAVRWPVLAGVDAEGLLLEPKEKPRACVVAVPDADQTPEQLVGLAKGVSEEAQFARRLAENGCRVLIPVLIDRQDTWSGSARLNRFTNQPHREFVYRMAYEMGRHIIGYEVQKILAAVDWFTREPDHPPVGVIGYGEGGLLALYSGALDPRIQATAVSGYFGPREEVWKEPIYRNVWGLLNEFGDAELAGMVQPRALLIEVSPAPDVKGPPPARAGRGGAAPGAISTPLAEKVRAELQRMPGQKIPSGKTPRLFSHDEKDHSLSLRTFVTDLVGENVDWKQSGTPPAERRKNFAPGPRQRRQLEQLIEHVQMLQRLSAATRQAYWSKLNPQTYSKTPEKWAAACQPYRDYFSEEVIGKLLAPTLPGKPRSREAYDTPKWKGYEVKLDLYPDVFAYGILLVPKDLKENERRPVVVCQHGLEGRPQDIVNPKQTTRFYNSFGARLAERGYIVYAPQNPYIGRDDFRVLQRKGNPLKLSLFSFIVRQHETTLDWLAGLPFVDPERIGFYGLSYGGKTAMRVPALVPRYCLSICSGDFNEWIWKNVNVDWVGSYMFTGEYEMFEYDLGQTFNYAEMAALIAPRPFMVERGHDDGVGLDENVAFEYAKVRRQFAKLGIAERTEIEFFSGGHEIHGQGTFAFLARHLKWPQGK